MIISMSTLASADAQKIAAYRARLELVLTPARLASYIPLGGNDLAVVTTYFWNAALTRDFHTSLGAAEIAARNGIHKALHIHTGHPAWYDRVVLLPREATALATVKKDIVAGGKPVIPGRVIAGLSFGFWTGLLSTGFGPHGYGKVLWSPNNAALIAQAFPLLAPLNQNRGYVHDRLNTLRLLRNRTSHHEPIWRGMTLRSGKTFSLAGLYTDILDTIGWVSIELRDSTHAYDRFPHTLQHGFTDHETMIKQHLGIS